MWSAWEQCELPDVMVFFICLAKESFKMPMTALSEEQVVAGLGTIVVDLATIC